MKLDSEGLKSRDVKENESRGRGSEFNDGVHG